MPPLAPQSTILVHFTHPLDDSHAEDLVQQIKNHGGSEDVEQRDRGDTRWRIVNKYYTADVEFSLVGKVSKNEEREEPAVIVLCPRNSKPTNEAQAILASLNSRATEFEVALLVTYTAHTAESTEVLEEEAWEDVAHAHGFEWVDLEGLSPDGGGIERVVTALHAHMWEDMVRQTSPVINSAEQTRTRGEEDEVNAYQAMGFPPLPDPKPFVPIHLEFPTTFLPSIPRSQPAPRPASVSTPYLAPSIALPSPTTVSPAFEDDFAPFVPILSSFPPPSPPRSHLYRHPELALPDSGLEGFQPLPDDEADEEDGEDLVIMFERLKALREEASSLGMDERRAVAERAVLALIGES